MSHPNRALARTAWSRFLDDVVADRSLASTLVEVETDGLRPRVQERGLLLRSMSYDPRRDAFEVTVMLPDPRREATLTHVVAGPTAIEVDAPAGVIPQEIRVSGSDGGRTTIRLDAPTVVSE